MIDWEGFGGVWKVLEGWIHRDCLILRSSDVFSFLDTSGLPDFMEFRCILGGSDVFHYDLRGDSLGALCM